MKNKKYFITSFLVLIIFTIIFFVENMFPFGNDSLVWSDMHEQIVPMYYHFYDSIFGDSSLLIDFTSSGGTNFIGVMAYYIMSPVSLVLLLFPRDMLLYGTSLVIVLKFLLAALSCLYFISKYFKKINTPYQILLSLLYTFSSYSFSLYVITSWMDIVYIFPFLMIGLKKLLDLEDTKLYIIMLVFSLVFCYYLSFILLLFIIFVSFIYLVVYKKENFKRSIFYLGFSTIISILISSFVLVPTFLQMFSSQRVGFEFDIIMSSGFGPLSDKLSFLFASGILIGLVFLLLLNWKKHKKFICFLLPVLLILGLPLIIEPINKMWHFGSYVYFPYRYGFILIFMLIVGASYYLNNVENKFKVPNFINKYLPYLCVVFTILGMGVLVFKYSVPILDSIDSLTFTKNKKVLIALFLIFVAMFVSTLFIFLNSKNKKSSIVLIYIVAFANILFNSYLYFGGYDPDDDLEFKYNQMLAVDDKVFDEGYYLKETDKFLISNYGMVMNLNTYSSFTSLIDKIGFYTFQRLGYDSFWMDTTSLGGNLFTDIVLANKYVVSNKEYDDVFYNYLYTEEKLNYYEYKYDMPYGYILNKNASLKYANNSFDASNIIYNSIMSDSNIFVIHDLFTSNDVSKINYMKDNVINKDLNIVGNKRLYLEIFSDFNNRNKSKNYDSFDVYVNDVLVYEKVPNIYRNGSLLLGEFKDTSVNVKIVSLKNSIVRNISIGELDLDKLNNFINDSSLIVKDLNLEENSVSFSVDGKKGDILFLPITYLDGYNGTHEIVRVFDNFIGVILNDGVNNVKLSYYPKGVVIGAVISLIGMVAFYIWNRYLSKLDCLILNNLVSSIYMLVFVLLSIVFYVVMPIIFLINFV